MKRILTLPLLVIVALVSQAWGEDPYASCDDDLGGKYYCQWTDGCYEINKGPQNLANCTDAKNGCVRDGYLYTGVTSTGKGETCNGTWAGVGNDPNFNNGVPLWCQWTTSCESIKNEAELDNCKTNGSVYRGVTSANIGTGKTCDGTWTGEGKDPTAVPLGCCKWSTETNCYPIYKEVNSEGQSGATQVENCKTGSNKFWEGSGTCPTTCPTTTPTYPPSTTSSSSTPASTTSSSSVATTTSSSSVASGTSSSSVATGGSSSSVAAGTSSSSDAGTSSPSGNSSSSGDDTPIISHNNAPVFGLSVTGLARGLQIASDKNATVSLFNIKGKLVLSQKVQSGTTTISLMNQKVGVYYAVAKSGSQKQIVKIVLK